jgi:hypothetical protein
MTAKIIPFQFPLSTQAGRVALLAGIMSGYVTKQEIAHAITQDMETRPRIKPVMAWGRRFESVTAAAHWAIRWKPDFCAKGIAGDHARLERARKLIARRATQDCWAGFYWCL